MSASKLVSGLVFLSTLALAVHGGSRYRRDLTEEEVNNGLENAGEEINGFFKKIWGGVCISNDQCLAAPYIAYCNREDGQAAKFTGGLIKADGECRPSIYLWIILAVILLLLVGACVCCCVCSICSCLLDFLCCCCRNKGYSPAGTG